MRRVYKDITFAGAATGNMASSLTSDAWSVEDADTYAVQVVFTGSSPTGTFALQASVDGTTYTTISSQAVTASGSILWENALCAVPMLQVIYTRTSGTGTATVKAFKKGTID